jgi:Calcineurin-like phosphoesterase/Thymidylate synthase
MSVATILHLTDLHLATPSDWAGADFAKSDIVPFQDRPDRLSAIRSTLQALAESARSDALTAVVVSGDIPFQNGTTGWEQFAEVFKPLAEAHKLPGPDKIVVAPGNHDVAWRTRLGDPAHYQKFITHVRDSGFVTPMLDGIDFNADGQITSSHPHYILDVETGIVIVPMNSSHYCGALEPWGRALSDDEWAKVLATVSASDTELADKLDDQVTWLREGDIARISEPQFKALTSLRIKIRTEIEDGGRDPSAFIWVAVFHHQLLPVSTLEEFKSYEAITNLGRFRQFLIDAGFQVVLHGHKHTAGTYWDRVHRRGEPVELPDRPLLVVSGSTLGSLTDATDEVARLLEADADFSRRAVEVQKIPLLDYAARVPDSLISQRAELWRAEMAEETRLPQIIFGETTSETYQRVQALFASLPRSDSAIADLICEVRSAEGASRPPFGYPVDRLPGGSAGANEWFTRTVNWWQRTESRLQFTHGQRLRSWGPGRVDQVNEAIRLLQNDPTSTRAVITLFDPNTDKPALAENEFPSFSFVQLLIRSIPGERQRLDCIGIFRKQEMRFWWPINVAELARLQRSVYERLGRPDLLFGSLITYASLAHVGEDVPDVNVTVVDQRADENEGRIWAMAYGIAHPESVDKSSVRADWVEVLSDLEPGPGDQVPRPRLGLKLLLDHLERFCSHAEGGPAHAIHDQLRTLDNDYDALAKGAGERAYWREEIRGALGQIRERVDELLSV